MSAWNGRDTPAVGDEIAVCCRPVPDSEPEAALTALVDLGAQR